MHLSQYDLCFCTNRESVATQICSLSASLASRLSMRLPCFVLFCFFRLCNGSWKRSFPLFVSSRFFSVRFLRSYQNFLFLSTYYQLCISKKKDHLLFLFPFVEWSFQSGSHEAKKLISSDNGSAGELVGNQETRTPFEANATCTTTTVTSKWQGKRSIVE